MYVCLFLVLFYRGYSWMFMFFEFILKLNTYHLLYTFYTVVTHDYLEQLYLKWIYLMAVTYVVLTLCCLYLWWLFIVLLNLYYDYIVVMLYVLIYTIILCCPCYMPKYVPRLEGIMHDPKGHISAHNMYNTILLLFLLWMSLVI